MGVTGTLDLLNKYEKKQIQEKYKVGKFTYMPSMFGDQRMEWNKIDFNSEYFVSIQEDYNKWTS